MNPIRRWLVRRANRREDRVRCPQCWAEPGERHTLSCPRTSIEEAFADLGLVLPEPRSDACDCGDTPHHPDCTVTQGLRAEADQRLTDHWHTAPKEH